MSRRRSPEALLDNAPCGLLRMRDADGTILWVNQTFCAWVGQDCDALIGNRRFQDLLTIGGRIFHQTHWAPLLRMQQSISEVKLDILGAEGKPIPMMLNALRREDDTGVIVQDIAAFVARDRDKYERELVLSRKRLEDLHAEAKDRALFAEQMIGIVSHDLRNPLSSIMMGAALLTRDVTPAQDRLLSKITRGADRANRLIADLLDFTQARLGGGIQVAPEPTDLHSSTAATVDDLAHTHPARVIQHVVMGEESGTCSVDPNRLAQLIGNLVSNALTYSAPESPITVTSFLMADSVSIAVHNDGVPIPDAVREKLFLPMTRGVKTASPTRSVGLGLFIVREIARAHDGTAAVTSTAEDGTTFTVVLPRR